jgi:hypothetical protein
VVQLENEVDLVDGRYQFSELSYDIDLHAESAIPEILVEGQGPLLLQLGRSPSWIERLAGPGQREGSPVERDKKSA